MKSVLLRVASLLGVMLAVTACSASSHPSASILANQAWFTPCFNGGAWRFRTDFEGRARLMQSRDGKNARFEGDSETDSCRGTAALSMRHGFILGRADIQYEGGNESERIARFVPDPLNPDNRVLQFWLAKPNVHRPDGLPLKGRVQMNLYENKGVHRLAMSVRLYLHPEMNLIQTYPGPVKWLTISEWWNNAGWTGEPYPFRISVHIVKESADFNVPLRFMVKSDAISYYTISAGGAGAKDGDLDAQPSRKAGNMSKKRDWDRDIWEYVNREFKVPVGKWMTLKYGFVEGDKETGRFFMAVAVDGEPQQILFDIRNYTHHPDDPAPDGLSHLNPIKLYTSSQLISHVQRQGGALQIFWDDLDVKACSDRIGDDKAGVGCTFGDVGKTDN